MVRRTTIILHVDQVALTFWLVILLSKNNSVDAIVCWT
jgi:hypothetical protein